MADDLPSVTQSAALMGLDPLPPALIALVDAARAAIRLRGAALCG
jgi:hypothetical protein